MPHDRRNIPLHVGLALAAFLLPWPAHAAAAGSERLNAFFEEVYQRDLDRSPMAQSRRGIRKDQDKWDDISEAHAIEEMALTRADLERLRTFDVGSLDRQDRLSYRLFERFSERGLEGFEWRRHGYLVSQMGGLHTRVASTLTSDHPIVTRDDAEDYIARLHGVKPLMAQLVTELERQEAAGVQPPRFVYPLVIDVAERLVSGAPFGESDEDSPLWADFQRKVGEASLDDSDGLLAAGRAAMLEGFGPGYRSLIAHLEAAMAKAGQTDGIWRLPDGDEYYRFLLERYTTLEQEPDALHELGIAEVARIHDEMRAIMRETGYEGSLTGFFDYVRTDPRFYYADSEAGRRQYLDDARRLLGEIEDRAGEILATMPRADVVVEPIEPWREKSAPKAHYRSPPPDGSRPGIFYINLYDMGAAPKYQLPVILYHEAVPGHHVETAIAYELEGLPKFRAFAGISAFSEGWGLYSELLPKEMGLYRDPYDDFGRLSLSLMRAVRLVVDTGIHAKRWTREQAIAYMDENMPSSHYDNRREIERYIVLPGQATSYYVGMLKILELRRRAKQALGDAFDIRAFHDTVLNDGPLPLPMLEENVDAWIEMSVAGK